MEKADRAQRRREARAKAKEQNKPLLVELTQDEVQIVLGMIEQVSAKGTGTMMALVAISQKFQKAQKGQRNKGKADAAAN